MNKNISSKRKTKDIDVYNQENIPKLRFPEFSDEWIETDLNQVIKEFINGQTPSRNHKEYWNGNIPWVSSGEL